MKILFTIAALHAKFGGPSYSLPALCNAVGQLGAGVEIITLNHEQASADAPSQNFRITEVRAPSSFARRLRWTPQFRSALNERIRESAAQIIHDTGLWLPTNHAAATASRSHKLPRIVSPRGMLTGWALRHKGWKKNLAWRLYQHRDLATAEILHATSAAEAEDFRAAGLRQPVAVIPNGVDVPPGKSNRVEKIEPTDRTILFLGRIHPVKGLLDLVSAWSRVRLPGWRVVVVGGDEMNHLAEIQSEIRRLNLDGCFEFPGPAEGAAKWDWYRRADLFVLPSHSENFGLVVVEALACGVPVITTRGTPWEDLLRHNCGWWTPVGADGLAGALRGAVSLSDEARREMGERGRTLVEKKFAWPGIAARMIEVYRWMLGQGAKPDCVET